MTRSQFLGTIRRALGKMEGVTTEKKSPLVSLEENYDHKTDPTTSQSQAFKDELHFRFIHEAQKNGTSIHQVDELKNIPNVLSRYVKEISPNRYLLRCLDRSILDLPWKSAGLEIESAPSTSDDKICISMGFSAIAETGTVILASSASNPSSLAFLPETHIVIVQKSHIHATLEEAFIHLLKVYDKKLLPQSVNLISGASRTGDIGGQIIHGAHGPLRFAVVVLTSDIPVYQ